LIYTAKHNLEDINSKISWELDWKRENNGPEVNSNITIGVNTNVCLNAESETQVNQKIQMW